MSLVMGRDLHRKLTTDVTTTTLPLLLPPEGTI